MAANVPFSGHRKSRCPFYHASAGKGVIFLYSRDNDKGLWYLPGSGLGPLGEGGRQLMKEAIAAGPH